jgi:hypothetical protein
MAQAKTVEELRKSDPFADGANLDLSRYPWIREENRASVVRADKDDVHLVSDGSHTNLLKNVEQMIERDGGDREIAEVLKAGGIENPARNKVTHTRRCKDTASSDSFQTTS